MYKSYLKCDKCGKECFWMKSSFFLVHIPNTGTSSNFWRNPNHRERHASLDICYITFISPSTRRKKLGDSRPPVPKYRSASAGKLTVARSKAKLSKGRTRLWTLSISTMRVYPILKQNSRRLIITLFFYFLTLSHFPELASADIQVVVILNLKRL